MAPTTMYVLHHDGVWHYNVSGHSGGRISTYHPHADGKPMTHLRDTWWTTDHEADTISVEIPQRQEVTGYTLGFDFTPSDKWPATLTPEEWEERGGHDNDTLTALYEAASITPPTVTRVIGPWVRLDGEPAPVDGLTWQMSLPYELRTHPEYGHLFPGHLAGFRDHLVEQIKQLPRVKAAYNLPGKPVSVYVDVPFDPPLTKWQKLPGKRKSSEVPKTVRRDLKLPVNDLVPGDTRVAAVTKWNEQTADWLAVVRSAGVAACTTCGGTGHVKTGAEAYDQ